MEKKTLLLGNEAVARGLFEAGVSFVSAYPGTPSTEITEAAAKYSEMYCEWAPNEKVAFEAAFGASLGGARSFCAMKHVGLNVAADPLYTASYIGVNGGMVCAVADDPGMHSSQNEQDSRHHAIASKTPMLEPSDSSECLSFAKLGFELSERFDSPFLLRLSTRVSHSRSLVSLSEREERELKEYKKDVMKNVMMPAMAKGAHVRVEKRTEALTEWADTEAVEKGVNTIEYFDRKLGVIAAGTAYTYAREALGEKASFLKLGLVNPLPIKLIKETAKHSALKLRERAFSRCSENFLRQRSKKPFLAKRRTRFPSPMKFRRVLLCFAPVVRIGAFITRSKGFTFMSAAISAAIRSVPRLRFQ